MVYICSPLKGDIEGNQKKAREWCKAASESGVIPLAPHTIFTQFLDDTILEQRQKGLELGKALLRRCDEVWVHGNTLSEGMIGEIILASQLGMPVIPKDMDRDNYQYVLAYQLVFKNDYNNEQWEEICKGLDEGIDVLTYTSPGLSANEMNEIRCQPEDVREGKRIRDQSNLLIDEDEYEDSWDEMEA